LRQFVEQEMRTDIAAASEGRAECAYRPLPLEFGWDGILAQLHASYREVLAACGSRLEVDAAEPRARPIHRPGRLILTNNAVRP